MTSEPTEAGRKRIDPGAPPDVAAPPPSADATAEAAGTTRFRCGRCGAELRYTPGTTRIGCPYCGFANEIDATETAVDELDYLEHIERLADGEIEEVDSIRCDACGAITDRPAHLDAFECVFCSADILSGATAQRLIRPRSLLPFHVRKDDAHQCFRAWIAGRWFAPTKLKRFAHSGGRLEGVYMPYWTYDSRTVTDYTGQRGEHYWVTQTYTTTVNGKKATRTRQVRKTRWHPAAGTVHNQFDDLLVLASRTLPPKYGHEIAPWDIENLVPYADDYVAGFRAERYQVDLRAGFDVAQQMMEDPIRRTIREDIGGDEQQIHSVDTRHFDVTFKHVLLPIWISAYRYRGKVYRFLVNGRTGEVQGERPWSAWKITGLVMAIVAVIALIVIVVALTQG
jgi:DNA-directed RNA polymerase subunit RPC12/RpoP